MKRSDVFYGSLDIVNNLLPGVLEATPMAAQTELLEILAKAKLVPMGELDYLGFILICVRYTFGSDVYIRSSRHRLLCVLFTTYVNEDIFLHD